MNCKHFKKQLKVSDRHFVNSPKHDNCILCLVNDQGSMTQDEVANILGISKVRVSQFEVQALRKLRLAQEKFIDFV